MYDNGLGVLQDYKEVVQWYRMAAEHHGVAGHLQGAEHQQEAPTAPYLSIPAEEARNHADQSGLVQRHLLFFRHLSNAKARRELLKTKRPHPPTTVLLT